MDLHRRSLLKEIDFTREEFLYPVDLGGRVRDDKRLGFARHRLADGRNNTANSLLVTGAPS